MKRIILLSLMPLLLTVSPATADDRICSSIG